MNSFWNKIISSILAFVGISSSQQTTLDKGKVELYVNNNEVIEKKEHVDVDKKYDAVLEKLGVTLTDKEITDKSITDKNIADKNIADKEISDKNITDKEIEVEFKENNFISSLKESVISVGEVSIVDDKNVENLEKNPDIFCLHFTCLNSLSDKLLSNGISKLYINSKCRISI